MKFDDSALLKAIGPRAPAALTREGRVRLLGEAFGALLDGRMPSREAALFLGGAGTSWLNEGGDLVRDFFKIVRPKSHETPQRVWRRISAHPDERKPEDESL